MPDITQLPILQTATNQTYLISVDKGIAKRVPLTGVGQITGPIGYVGSTGVVGYTGSVSTVPGYAGSKGYGGSTGYTGSSGEYAAMGYFGSRGYTGSIGPSTLLNVIATNTSTYEYVVGMPRAGTDIQAVISTANPFVFVPSTGNVGIGNSNPLGTLHLKAAEIPELYFEQANTSTMHKIHAKGGSLYIDIDTGNFGGGSNFYVSQAGTNKLVLNNQGYFGVNTNIPVETLDVAGNIRFTNTATLPGLDEGYGLLYQYSNLDLRYETQRWAGDTVNGPVYAGTQLVGTVNPAQTSGVADFYLTTNVTTTANQTWEKVLELRTDQIEAYQNFKIDGDLEVDGGDIVTLNPSFNLLNTTATTVNAFGVAAVLNIGTSLSAGAGFATFGQHSLVGTNSTQYLFDTIASTVNAFGNASTLNMGGASGVATLRNPVLVGVYHTQDVYNTAALTVNFAGQAPTVNIAVGTTTATSVTIGNTSGTVYIPGNLEVKGAVTYLETTNTAIKDSLIELHTTFEGNGDISTTTVNDTADIGLRLHYNDGAEKNAALVMAYDTRFLEWYQTGAENLPNSFAGNYGTFKTGSSILVDPTGTYSTNTGALTVVGGVGMGGGLFVGAVTTLTGNTYIGSNLTVTGFSSLNGGATISAATVTNTLSVGDSLTVTGFTSLNGGVTASALTITNAVSVGTALAVTGFSSLNGGATISAATVTNNLIVSGESILQGLTATIITATSITVSGTLTVGGVAVVLADTTTTNARTAITVTQSTLASTSTLTYTTSTGVINFTPAFGLGLQGETWHDVLSTPGRSVNTPYTNPNLYPIMVNVSLIGSNTTATSAAVSGVQVAYTANTSTVGTWTSSASFIVPPKTTYICSGTGVMSWAELY